MFSNFTHRGYGRIYVSKEEDIVKVKEVIAEMDEEELRYLPEEFITTFGQYPKVIYSHRFSDLDLNALMANCMYRGIMVFCLNAGNQEHIKSAILPPKRRSFIDGTGDEQIMQD
jgi:hypothetical protein